jgi:hypothetical protein
MYPVAIVISFALPLLQIAKIILKKVSITSGISSSGAPSISIMRRYISFSTLRLAEIRGIE